MKNKTRRFSKSAFSVILALCMLLSCLTVGVIPTGAASIDYVDDWTKQAQKDVAAGAQAVYDASVGASAGESVGDDPTFYYDFRNISGGVNYYSGNGLKYDANGGGKIKVGTLPSGDTVIAKWEAGGWDTTEVKANDSSIGSNDMLIVTSDTTYSFGTYVPLYYVRGGAAGLSWDSGAEMSVTGTIRYLYVNAATEFKIVSPDGWAADGCTEYASINNSHTGANITLSTQNNNDNVNVYISSPGYICFDTSTEEIYARSTSPATSPAASSVTLTQTTTGNIYTNETSVAFSYSVSDLVSGGTLTKYVDGTSAGTVSGSSGTFNVTFNSAGEHTVALTASKTSYESVSDEVSVTVVDRPSVYIVGGFRPGVWSGNNDNKMTYNSTDDCYYVEQDLNSSYSYPQNGNWGFGVMVGTTLYKNSGTMSSTNCTNWTFSTSAQNCGITPSVTGTYIFKVKLDNGTPKVSLLYPHTVTFDANNHGTAPSAVVATYNTTITAPTAPTATGYTFGGWYKEAECTNAWNFSTDKVTADTTLYAKWTQDEYSINYPTPSNYTLAGTKPASAYYNETVSFTVTAASGYRITGVTYTPSGGSAQNCTAGSNNTYSFTMPAANVTISVTTVNTYTVTLIAGEGFDTKQYRKGTSGSYQDYSSTITVDAGTVVYFKVTYSTGYEYSSKSSNLTMVTANTVFKTSAINANTTITVTSSMINYDLNGVTIPEGKGSVKFYSDPACSTLVTTANYGNTVYAKYDPETSGYILKSFSISGTGASLGTRNGNVIPVTVGSEDVIVTANLILQYSVTYYVDMHDNNVSSLSVAICSQGWATVLKDSNGNDCSATLGNTSGVYQLTKQGNSTVYAATINTPVTQTSGGYSDVYIRVTFNGTNYNTINVPGTKVATLVSTHEMWLEAENEASTALKVNYATNATPTVADGNRRIYLAKPYSWQDDEPTWENIGIYHWGNYTDIGWNAGTKMHYLGNSGSDGYHYYYVDIPKAIDGNKVSNLIFQGWGSNQSAGTYSKSQTGNIENIPDSANFFYLSKVDGAFAGTKSEEDAVIPNYTRYVSSVEMNKTETTAVSVKPTYTGENVTYTSSNTSVVTVDGNGNITPVGRGTATITVKIYGTIGSLVTTEDNDHKDYRTYTVSVTVKDPAQFYGFEIMSLESKTYTVNIPAVSGNQPGYFDMSNVVMTVEGIHGVASSTNSAIITPSTTDTVTVDGNTYPCSFTVKYAKANSLFENYGDISVIGKVVTKSIKLSNTQRYGHDHWIEDGTTKTYTTSREINNGIETATTDGIPFDNTKTTYSAIFVPYDYVDVTFTFNYWEYKPKKVDAEGNVVADDADGMIQYPYDTTWACGEDTSNANFAASHTLKTYTVSNYEVRYKTADNITTTDLANAAATAIGVRPSNNYYNYSIAAANTTKTKTGTYNVTSTVNMTQTVRHYSVYLNGSTVVGTNYTYQQYAEPTIGTASKWYAVDERYATVVTNAPLLATGTSYKFRVKGDTYLRTVSGTTGVEDLRSEVDFSHFEIIHRENTNQELVDYLLQNFYIADFFSPSKVLDPNSNNGQGNLPYDDAQFVGGGVVYYSMNGVTDNNPGTPFANAVSSGYVNGDTGEANAAAIKEMLKANIEAYHSDDVSRALGEEEAMKIAYGTEIKATKNVEGGFNTGIIYRYLPMNQYKRNGAGEQTVDIELTSSNNIVKWTPSSKVENKWQVTSVNDVNDTASNGQRTVRFVNNQGWDVVCVHYWGGSKASYWPGIKMIAVEGQDNVYEAVIPADSTHVVFSDGGYMPETNANGEYTLKKDVNSNTFRYSNTLQSYQYVYASGNENKATNAGKNMRLYSYYVYSYVAYNQETNVPETRYEIVLSDNYSDASTYWEGPNN